MESLKISYLQNDRDIDAEGELSWIAQTWVLLLGGVQSYIDVCGVAIWFVEEIYTFNINNHHQNYNNIKYYIYYLVTP